MDNGLILLIFQNVKHIEHCIQESVNDYGQGYNLKKVINSVNYNTKSRKTLTYQYTNLLDARLAGLLCDLI